MDAGALRLLRTSIPFISKAENIHPAVGGVDPETIADLKARAAIDLRARNRAVSTADFELLTQQASPSLVRTKFERVDSGARAPSWFSSFLISNRDAFLRVAPSSRGNSGQRKEVHRRAAPGGNHGSNRASRHMGIFVAARLAIHSQADQEQVLTAADDAIANFLHPSHGGYDGTGWPFGHDVSVGDIYSYAPAGSGADVCGRRSINSHRRSLWNKGRANGQISLKPHDLLYSLPSDFEVIQQ